MFDVTKLRERREALGWSRPVLAEKVGISPRSIARYENGKSCPPSGKATKLEYELKVGEGKALSPEDTTLLVGTAAAATVLAGASALIMHLMSIPSRDEVRKIVREELRAAPRGDEFSSLGRGPQDDEWGPARGNLNEAVRRVVATLPMRKVAPFRSWVAMGQPLKPSTRWLEEHGFSEQRWAHHCKLFSARVKEELQSMLNDEIRAIGEQP